MPVDDGLIGGIHVTRLARAEAGAPHDHEAFQASTLDALMRPMLLFSDNAAANAVERYYGGSTSAGSRLVNALMRSLGLTDTEMYGGYELDALAPTARSNAMPLAMTAISNSFGTGALSTSVAVANPSGEPMAKLNSQSRKAMPTNSSTPVIR